MNIEKRTYKGKLYKGNQQPDIVIVDNGEIPSRPGMYGPWVRWKLPWDADDQSRTSLRPVVEDLLKLTCEVDLGESCPTKSQPFPSAPIGSP